MAKFAHLFQSSVGSILTDFLCSGARQAHKQAAIPPKTAKNPANNHNQLSARHLTQRLKAEVEIGGQKAERIARDELKRRGRRINLGRRRRIKKPRQNDGLTSFLEFCSRGLRGWRFNEFPSSARPLAMKHKEQNI
jgi:hypothetical protein